MNTIFRKLLAHTTVRLGLGVLGLLIVIALTAPWLGTVDPAAMGWEPITAFMIWACAEAGRP